MFDPKKEVYYDGILNVTPKHLIQAAKIFKPDIMIGLDNPIPKLIGKKDKMKQELTFLQYHGFNLRWAKETAQLRKEYCSEITLLIPIQAYTLQQMKFFIEDFGTESCDGFSIPVRNHSPIEIAIFLLQLHYYGVRKAHILGTFTFKTIALAAYFARHFFDFISLDCTLWRKDAEYSKYYLPHDLRSITLQDQYLIDESIEINCSCPWCRGKSFTEIKNMPYEERYSFLQRHNYYVIEEAMRDFYEHAENSYSLSNYLLNVSGRITEIWEIYNCLQNIEIIKNYLSDQAIEILNNVINVNSK